MSTLQQGEDMAAAVAVAPRVSLDDITSQIVQEHYFTLAEALVGIAVLDGAKEINLSRTLGTTAMYGLTMANGGVSVGKSAPAHPDNFDRELGQKLARDDAIRPLWAHMGWALRDRLYHEEKDNG